MIQWAELPIGGVEAHAVFVPLRMIGAITTYVAGPALSVAAVLVCDADRCNTQKGEDR